MKHFFKAAAALTGLVLAALFLALAFVLPMQATMGYFYTFFSNHFLTLPGSDNALLGACYLISACSEIKVMISYR